jgi:P27 family predicted phage terminase small subunit
MKGKPPKAKKNAATTDRPTLNLQAEHPPEWLNPTAAGIWRETLEHLHRAGGAMPRRFLQTMGSFCISSAAARDADAVLQREGLTVDDGRQGTRRHPCVAIRSQALAQTRLLAESLGLTPGSAGRLPMRDPNGDSIDDVPDDIWRTFSKREIEAYHAQHGRWPTNPFDMF